MSSDPTAPRKVLKKRKAVTTIHESSSNDEESPRKKSKSSSNPTPLRRRKKPKSVATAIAIPRSYDECTECDKMLIDWREGDRTWADIREEWEKLTGEKTGNSTLPNRHKRLMDNFANIKDEDKAKLIIAKQQVENEFEKEKWSKISQVMKNMEAQESYDPELIKRVHGKMMKNAEDLPAIRYGVGKTSDGNGEAESESGSPDAEE